ncbi:carboxypeptidase-like regulatory domain-containing protein [Bifidobacterium moukalabense]|uniref:carboxypeptidase-like regulatory domain-containing protein n=1 Tax=Bifidobacterium moukalabense TaxID=1333651 RepID=UPI0014857CEC|nr:carboxypeptidase-like regulatory domain-containing protein [Bifidobacterium moukalabense]
MSGIVADTAGNPIAGVAVTLSGPKTLTATTDEDSSFDLDAGDGGWALTVTADGYADGT